MELRKAMASGWARCFRRVPVAKFEQPEYRASEQDAPIAGIDPLMAEALLQLLHQVSDGQKSARQGTVCADGNWSRELLATIRQLTAHKIARMQARIEELSALSRTSDRKIGNQELTSSHLRDEIARCRTLIMDEYLRNGMTLPADPQKNLHDEITAFLAALDRKKTSAGANLNDPVLEALNTLIESKDPGSLAHFPEWMKKPAANVLELIAERNRYKRLLEHAGMLPTEPR
jgi:hypothetical protein